MRDLVYQPVPSQPSNNPEVIVANPLTPTPASSHPRVEKFFLLLEKWSNTLHRGLNKDGVLSIVEMPRRDSSTHEEKIPIGIGIKPEKAITQKRRPAKERINVIEKTQKLKEKSKARLASPFVRSHIIQTALVLGLFGYVLYSQHHIALSTKVAETPQSTPRVLRQYLPTTTDAKDVQPFQEKLISATSPQIPLYAWVTPWNNHDIQQHLTTYSSLSAFWATVNSDAIHVDPKSEWANWDAFRTGIPTTSTQTIYLTISGDQNVTYHDLSNPIVQAQHITELLNVVRSHNFDGIDINYEGLGHENRDQFSQFIKALSAQFHQANKKVAVTVEARINNAVPMDWAALSTAADEVRVMAYNYHSCTTGTPSPVTPLGWLRDVLEYSHHAIDSKKLVIGLGNYGCDWALQSDGSYRGVGLSYEQAMATSQAHSAPLVTVDTINDDGYDTGAVRTFTYQGADNLQHTVYFEDSASLQDKLALINQYQAAGIIFWTVGLGDITLDTAVQ